MGWDTSSIASSDSGYYSGSSASSSRRSSVSSQHSTRRVGSNGSLTALDATDAYIPSANIFSNENIPKADIPYSLKKFEQLHPTTWTKEGIYGIKAVALDVDDTLSRFSFNPFAERTIDPALIKQLKSLHDSGLKIGIISNNPSSCLIDKLRLKLQKAGIHNVHAVCNAQKPGVAGLEEYQKHVGLKPNQIMMVGDNPHTDILAGKMAGFRTVHVDWYQRSDFHKTLMKLGDVFLGWMNKLINFFRTTATVPKFLPALSLPSLPSFIKL